MPKHKPTCPRCGNDDLGTMVYASGERAWCSTGCGWIASSEPSPNGHAEGAGDALESASIVDAGHRALSAASEPKGGEA